MSDSDFGGFAPTTPAPKPKASIRSKQAKPASTNSQAGPSSKPGRDRRKKTQPLPSEDSDVQEIEIEGVAVQEDADNEDDEVVHIEAPAPTRSRKPPTHPDLPATNKKATTKGKAKAKAVTNTANRKPAKPVEGSVEEIETDEEMEDNAAEDLASVINAAMSKATSSKPIKKGDENSKLHLKLQQLEAQNETLTQQLEEALRIRETEAEELRRQQEAQYLAQIQAQELLIKNLTEQLAQSQPLMRTGKSSILHLITREAAEEEMRDMEKEREQLKALVKEAHKTISEKDVLIGELRQSVQDARVELKAEIDRANELANRASRNPPSATKTRTGNGLADPKNTEVIKFYEDVTNLLIPTVKLNKSKYLDLDDWTFTCVYTCSAEEDVDNSKSLNFTLRFVLEPMKDFTGNITSEDQLVQSVHYTPLSLEKESPEFVEKLNFMKDAFTFPREQLSLFLTTLYDNMSAAIKDDNEDVEVTE